MDPKDTLILNELQKFLDYAGFRYRSAYKVVGIHGPDYLSRLSKSGKKQIALDKMVALTEAIREALPSGKYPQCVDADHEVEQLETLLEQYIQKHK